MKLWQGQCVYPGMAFAKIVREAKVKSPDEVFFSGVEPELSLFRKALAKTEAQIESIKAAAAEKLGPKEAEIFEAHRMMLTDPEFVEGIESEIQSPRQVPAAKAIHQVSEQFAQTLLLASSEYLRERVADIRDISARLTKNLYASESDLSPGEPFIYIGTDLAPSDLMGLTEGPLQGVVLAKGGMTSHTSILLKAMGIPSLIGVLEAETWLAETPSAEGKGFLNSTAGHFEVNPSARDHDQYEKLLRDQALALKELETWKGRPSRLQTGESLPLLANVGNQKQLEEAQAQGAEGVGLYRTEFLFLEALKAPSLEEQTEIYRQGVRGLGGKTLVVRTLDIGGDKPVPYLNLPKEENPFLGVRGLRLCLQHTGIFITQMKALIQASEEGPVDVMFPMVTSPSELEEAFALIEPLKTSRMKIRWGMMLEIPQNIFMIPEFSRRMEFFSVGSNDLTQYLTACDRQNPQVQSLNDPYSPGVLRALAFLAREVRTARRELSICGEIAADQTLLPFTVGLGVNKLSMSARMIPPQRARLARLSKGLCEGAVDEVLACPDRESVLRVLRRFE